MVETDLIEIKNMSDFEFVQYFHSALEAGATGCRLDDKDYQFLRTKFIQNSKFKAYIPSWLKINRAEGQYWNFIKFKYDNYADRREFLKMEFSKILDYLEFSKESPVVATIKFGEPYIHEQWNKAIERKKDDPEGAITLSKTLLESVFKHILEKETIDYNDSKDDLPKLYGRVSKVLNLAPDKHNELILKQILGGVNTTVNGLGALRNKLGDAHGKSQTTYKPKERHSELAVNLAGSIAMFIFQTYKENME